MQTGREIIQVNFTHYPSIYMNQFWGNEDIT